MIMANDVL